MSINSLKIACAILFINVYYILMEVYILIGILRSRRIAFYRSLRFLCYYDQQQYL